MCSKVDGTYKNLTPTVNRDSLESHKLPATADGSKPTFEDLSEKAVLINNCNTLIEVTVKAKGRKRTSTMVSSSPMGPKIVEEKRRPSNSTESYPKWSRVLREQNQPVMKQGLQQLMLQTKSSKSTKHTADLKQNRKSSDVQNHQKLNLGHDKRSTEKPVKQAGKTTSQKVIQSGPSLASNIDSVLVMDRAVQCNGIIDFANKYEVFNPIRTLGFLMKELKDLVKDEKSTKVLTDMEQVLLGVPIDLGKSAVTQDFEAIALRAKLEASTIQLEQTSKKMKTMCESLREERNLLQHQVHTQTTALEEARQRQINLEATVKQLQQELNEAVKAGQIKEKTLFQLQEEKKCIELSQKIIADLKTNLKEQTELAQQRHLEMQYLILEKEKLSALSSYKDSLLMELRHAMKELQSHIADQLVDMREVNCSEENTNVQSSVLQGGLVCSSPTSSSSERSNIAASWRDISDVSLSTIERNTDKESRNSFAEKNKVLSANSHDDIKTDAAKATNGSRMKDSMQVEFISLPGGESSHTILFPPCKDHVCKDFNQIANADATSRNNKKENNLCSNINDATKWTDTECLACSAEKNNTKETEKNSSKARKSLPFNGKRDPEKKRSFHEDLSKFVIGNLANDPVGCNIKEQVQNMFQDIRLQSKAPIDVPSPPRDYPRPDWSDSSLPSIGAVSELNVRSKETWMYSYEET